MAQNSDPLPFTQVDRAVRPKATALAGFLGTTPQHALGSLIDFWELCGDPREIERLLEKGIDEVVLASDEISGRFEIASGKSVDPKRLVTLGLLEAQPGGDFRVRGMSRYFEPIRRRLQARAAAKAGGLASVRARKAANGTAQPSPGPLNGRSGDGSEAAQATAQAGVEAAPKRPRSDSRSDAEAGTEAAPNTEDIGQRTSDISKEEEAAPAPVEPRGVIHHEKPETQPEGWLSPEFFRWAQHIRQINGYLGEPWPKGHALRDWFAGAISTPGVTITRLKRGFLSYGESEFWKPKGYPFSGFMSQWISFMPQELPHAIRRG